LTEKETRAYSIYITKSQAKRLYERCECRWKDKSKMRFEEVQYEIYVMNSTGLG